MPDSEQQIADYLNYLRAQMHMFQHLPESKPKPRVMGKGLLDSGWQSCMPFLLWQWPHRAALPHWKSHTVDQNQKTHIYGGWVFPWRRIKITKASDKWPKNNH